MHRPALTIVWLPNGHTSGYRPGFPIPQATAFDRAYPAEKDVFMPKEE